MQAITIYLRPSGTVSEFLQDFNVYQDGDNTFILKIAVPLRVFPKNIPNSGDLSTIAVTVAEIGVDRKGERFQTEKHNLKWIKDFEKVIQNLDREHVGIFSPNGKLYTIVGGDRNAYINPILHDKLKGATVIHNHPEEKSLSNADLKIAIMYKTNSISAITKNGSKYTIEIDSTAKLNALEVDKEYAKLFDEAREAKMNGMIEKGIDLQDIVIRELTKRFGGLNYVVRH